MHLPYLLVQRPLMLFRILEEACEKSFECFSNDFLQITTSCSCLSSSYLFALCAPGFSFSARHLNLSSWLFYSPLIHTLNTSIFVTFLWNPAGASPYFSSTPDYEPKNVILGFLPIQLMPNKCQYLNVWKRLWPHRIMCRRLREEASSLPVPVPGGTVGGAGTQRHRQNNITLTLNTPTPLRVLREVSTRKWSNHNTVICF